MPTTKSESLVLVSKQTGFVIIPAATPLTRLNYFDGKFLRASDLNAEQNYLRQLVAQSNQAGGAGVAHGFDLTLGGGDNLEIGPGLAIDPSGRVLLLPQGTTIGVQELIDKSRDLQRLFGGASVVRAGSFERCELDDGPLTGATAASNLYLIVISPAEALCGEEDVYGKLCEEACATSTDRPFAVEGLTVRAIPLVLRTPLPDPKVVALTQAHLRSRVASAYFEDERRRVASLISSNGLQQETWCLGADAAGGSGVPIGVLARSGPTTVFLDPWIARRERIDAPAKRYWQWRMMMRPWDVFLAQVLQFQCQLHDLFRKAPVPGDVDPCGGARGALREAADTISELRQFYQAAAQRFLTLNVNPEEFAFSGGSSKLTAIHDRLVSVGQGLAQLPTDRFLINGGIVELPSAGYLPVAPGAAAATINQQVRRLMGEGVDLRFCVVRPDYVAHALEEAQHMERISLLQGLDDPKNKPEVDILVPNGEILEQKQLSPGNGFVASVELNQALFLAPTFNATGLAQPPVQSMNFRGAARAETLPTGGGAFYLSADHKESFFNQQNVDGGIVSPAPTTGATPGATPPAPVTANFLNTNAIRLPPQFGLWTSLRCDSNVFRLSRGDTANFNVRAIVASTHGDLPLFDLELNGIFQLTRDPLTTGTVQTVLGHTENAQFSLRSDRFGTGTDRITKPVTLDVTVILTAASAIEIRFGKERNGLAFFANWGKQPMEVSARITQEIATRNLLTIDWAKAELREDADVLSATNASHIQALAALEVVARTLSDTNFADAKTRLLFPPPPKPTDELLVRGTTDWVLFHRRRNKRCSADLPPPVVVADRRFALWMGVAANANAVQVIAKGLKDGTPISPDLVFFRRVDVVEFNSGLATMISRPEELLADWQLTDPGETIVHTVIASQNANDGETVAQGRLKRVEQAIATVSKGQAATTSEVHDSVHPDLAVPGVDGVIAVITLKDLKTMCHPVFRVRQQKDFLPALEAIGQGQIQDAIGKFQLTLLGTVLFKVDSAEVAVPDSLAAVKSNWDAFGGGLPSEMAVISHLGHNVSVVQLEQARAIYTAIGPIVEEPFHFETSVELPASPIPCPVFSLIVERAAEPQRRRDLLIFATVGDARHFPDEGRRITQITFTNSVPDGTSLDVALRTAKIAGQVSGVTIASIAATEPSMADRLTAVVEAVRKVGGPIGRVALSQRSTQLSREDTDALAGNRISLTNIEEVIFIEIVEPG